MKTKNISRFSKTVLCTAISTLMLPPQVSAAPLVLSTAPASTAHRPAAPNVIISVDDSGSMGATGMATLRNALKDTFSALNVPDHAIRLGWQSMTACFTIPSGGDCNNQNALRVLDSTHRNRFMTWVDTLSIKSGTPSHRMLFNAGQYLRTAPGVSSPWASIPGERQEPMLSCRKSYNLFMTDGGWNTTAGWSNTNAAAGAAISNADGTSRTLPDGKTYDSTSPQTRIYRDGFGATNLPTFADLAFHYWATDLQPAMANEVQPRIRQAGNQAVPGDGSFLLEEYWNPRNDPATWQHMTTYTVGFNAAANWNGTTARPLFGADTWTGASFDGLVLGTTPWTNPITGNETTRMPELWHAALNGRGKFIPAPTAQSLAPAFRDILNDIIADKTKPVTSMALSASTTQEGSQAYTAGYDGAKWSGSVAAYNLAAETGAIDPAGAWGQEPAIPATATTPAVPARPTTTADLMDRTSFSHTARTVLSSQPATGGGGGFAWTWAALSASQKAELNSVNGVTDTLGEQRLNFLRGDRSKEGSPFRVRGSRHGDIVNSKIWRMPGYTKGSKTASAGARSTMLYVGANDGMLHGFEASTGAEKLAYIPQGVHARLSALTHPDYVHRYYVDGSPFTADVDIGGWKSYLAGFLGAGGKGYFLLDVTNPDTFASTSPGTVVVMDKTATVDSDVGHIFSAPVTDQTNDKLATQITRMNDGRWALISGNGYNSSSEKAALLIQYLDGSKELKKIVADDTGSNGNGLSAPRLLDINGDGKVDMAYAGDLNGNVWKFDLTSATASSWKVSFAGTPLFTTAPGQAITTAPSWMYHPDGGIMVLVGTGRNLTDADRVSTNQQALYGLYDPTKIIVTPGTGSNPATLSLDDTSHAITGTSQLVQQTIGTSSTGTTTTSNALFTLSSNPVPYIGTGAKKGWYVNLPNSKERMLDNFRWIRGRLFEAKTTLPTPNSNSEEETCTPQTSADQFSKLAFDALNGGAPKSQIYGAESGTGSYVKDAPRVDGDLTNTGTGGSISVTPPGKKFPGKNAAAVTRLTPTWRQAQ